MRCWKLGLTYRIVQLALLCYLIGYWRPNVIVIEERCVVGILNRLTTKWLFIPNILLFRYVFIYSKSYQRFDSPGSSVVTRINGILRRNKTNGETDLWDSTDFVVPAQVRGGALVFGCFLFLHIDKSTCKWIELFFTASFTLSFYRKISMALSWMCWVTVIVRLCDPKYVLFFQGFF